MIISVVNEKGGSGKTTIAVNLAFKFAEQGLDLMLIDADPQRSVETMLNNRVNSGLELPFASMSKIGDTLAKESVNLTSKYSCVVVDTGGLDSKEMRLALTVSDIVLIPTIITSSYDQAVLNKMLALINEVSILNPKLKALIINNRASPNPMLQGKIGKYVDFLKELDFPENIKIANTTLYEREIYKSVVFDGKSVTELENDNKAKDEINALYDEILEIYKGKE